MTDVVSIPNEESIRAAFAEAEREAAFWREHYHEYVKLYPDQFVMVSKADKQVVAVSPSLDGVIDLAESRGFRVGTTWLEFIAATPMHLRF